MNENAWLNDLKVGDEVAVWTSSYGSGYYEFRKIDKVHKAHFVVGGSKYRRDSGRQAGETWHPAYLRQATDDLKAEVATLKRVNILGRKFEGIQWRGLSLETLEAIDAILSAKQ